MTMRIRQIIKGKTGVAVVLLLIAVLCIAIISMTAYTTTLQYDINNINSKISSAEWEQRNLEAKIKSSNTLSSLEASAMDMGLVRPSFSQIIYLDIAEDGLRDFALALKEIAYNR